ncbi:kinase-like domain-containing protein [Lineolata rhizophorae]|uniref:non-specific serine/threonine protein kinase n=1 Tax=Lineolata rhizophorae TaxID=578093 RepID=A0A6A6NNW8_9PEZI|nr:kinase-like domain-containing protein [Lineolata rhizophorae]
MPVFFRSFSRLSSSCFTARRFSSIIRTPGIDTVGAFEEETLPWYKPEQFYPVRIGETLNSTYKVLGKLGYGAYSTSWLCRNLKYATIKVFSGSSADPPDRNEDYVTIKVCTQEAARSARLRRELQFYKHVSTMDSKHIGTAFIRSLFEAFEISTPAGQHLCLVHPPMHMTIRELQYKNPSQRLNEPLIKWVLMNTFRALSFLHDEAHVVHTESRTRRPVATKVIDNARTIYGSRKLGLPKGIEWGQPVLCDFGEARIGDVHKSVDIWSVGVMLWDLFENQHLFNAQDEEKKSSATHHIAEMIAYLGMPPLEYTRRSDDMRHVFDDDDLLGRWKWTGKYDIPPISLEESERNLSDENKQRFLEFVRSMLRWLP